MVTGLNGFRTRTLFTVGDRLGSYQPIGILDGLGLISFDGETRLLVNHEVRANAGLPYTLANGLELIGARISEFRIDPRTLSVISARVAFDQIRDRSGRLVEEAAQVNERGDTQNGLTVFCSSQLIPAGSFGFVDDIYITGEELEVRYRASGGGLWGLDIRNRELWGLPDLGRGTWENVTPLDTGQPDTIALLMGDDDKPAPLYLYLGRTSSESDADFPTRNGLRGGQLYVWVETSGANTADTLPSGQELRPGHFVAVDVGGPDQAGNTGYDALGWADSTTIRDQARSLGAFFFARPEDVHTNPGNPAVAVLAVTGWHKISEVDVWGGIHLVEPDLSALGSTEDTPVLPDRLPGLLRTVYDGDQLPEPDAGIRNPDNLVWASDGFIYIQEDSAVPDGWFGATSRQEASVWQLDPETGNAVRIAVVNRSVVLPAGSTDRKAGEYGGWETSGIIDATNVLSSDPRKTVLLMTVQAHGITDGEIGGWKGLVQGGQIVALYQAP